MTKTIIHPVRIQRSRQHKQVSPNGLPIVYVGRPSKYGNPFKVGDYHEHLFGTIETVDEAMTAFKNVIGFGDDYETSNGENRDYEAFNAYIMPMAFYNWDKIRADLKGKNLSCWCSLKCQCHADVLLKIANS